MDDLAKKLENIFPLVIGLVVTKREDKVNVCPVNWQVVSTKYELPVTICIGLSHTSYSLETIKKTKEFTFVYPSKDQLDDSIYCGTVTGRNVDKIGNTSFEFVNAKHVQAPHIKNAVMNFECEVKQIVTLDTFDIVVAEVLNIETSTKSALDKIYALGKMNYGSISSTSVNKIGRE